METNELAEMCDELYDLYEKIKREVRQRDSFEYERWKAGGFLLDDGIISMYPSLNSVVEALTGEEDEEELTEEKES